MKAKEMMLPRQNKNAIRIMINNDDDADDIARKRDEAQKEYGVVNEEPKKPIREETSLRSSQQLRIWVRIVSLVPLPKM